MKKIYISPAVEVVKLRMVAPLLIGSLIDTDATGDALSREGDDLGIFDDDVINARELEEW